MMKSTHTLARLFLALSALFLVSVALADPYPAKPIRMVVGFPPGGGNDLIARLIGAKLQQAWGQPVIVDNKPGANAIIATEFVAKAAPDGYTLLVGASGAMTVNPALYPNLGYDPVKDFEPVTIIGSFPLVLAVHPSLNARSVRELVRLAKGAPGTLNYGSGSTPFQFAAELFKLRTGADINHVAYKGSVQTINDLLANEVQMTFVDTGSIVPQIKAGKLRALAVTSVRRSAALPDVPTLIEAGIPDFDVVLWVSLFTPAATPRTIVDQLQREIAKIARMPDVRERLAALGIEAVGSSSEVLRVALKTELARWLTVAKSANIKAE